MSANVLNSFGSVRRAIKISEQFWQVERIFAFRSERCDELTEQRSKFRRGRFSPPWACPDGRRWPAISRQCLSPSPLACARDENLGSRRFDSINFRGCSPMPPKIGWKLLRRPPRREAPPGQPKIEEGKIPASHIIISCVHLILPPKGCALSRAHVPCRVVSLCYKAVITPAQGPYIDLKTVRI